MKLYAVPIIKQNPETIVIHCGTNNLKTEKDQVKIADNMLWLARQCSNDNNNVISGINFDIFTTTKSKLDSSFQDSQYHIPGYELLRKDRNINGGDLICYINQDLPTKIVTRYKCPTNLEVSPIEITLGKIISLLGLYITPFYSENYFYFHLENALSH